jgi:hypothetical protein
VARRGPGRSLPRGLGCGRLVSGALGPVHAGENSVRLVTACVLSVYVPRCIVHTRRRVFFQRFNSCLSPEFECFASAFRPPGECASMGFGLGATRAAVRSF